MGRRDRGPRVRRVPDPRRERFHDAGGTGLHLRRLGHAGAYELGQIIVRYEGFPRFFRHHSRHRDDAGEAGGGSQRRGAAAEPDVALNYEELGDVYSLMQQDDKAEKSYREAIRRERRLANSYVGLAKVYEREEKYQQALAAIDSASKVDPGRTDVHYLRGQTLMHLGRKIAGKKELETAVRLDNERRAAREKQMEAGTAASPVPSPELLQGEQ